MAWSPGPSAAIGMLVRFAGIPYVFADFPQPDVAGWGSASGSVTIDGESYTWSRTFNMPSALSTSATYDPHLHRVYAGGVSLDFILPGTQDPFSENPWLGLINTDPQRADQNYTVLKGTIDADDTTADVASTTGWPASGAINIGIERISYSGVTATSFTGLVRGRHGSLPQEHRAAFTGQADQSTGAEVTSHHTTWKGRTARFWLVRGDIIDGVFVPDATTIEDADTDLLFNHEVTDGTMDGAASMARLPANSIETIMQRQCATRLPRALAGLRDGEELYRVDATISDLTWRWVTSNNATQVENVDGPITSVLQNDTGGGVTGDVTAGWYTREEMETFLTWTVFYSGAKTPFWFTPATDEAAIKLSKDSDETVSYTVTCQPGLGGVTTTWSIAFTLFGFSPASVVRSMGFENIHTSYQEEAGGSDWQEFPAAEASRPRARLYLPLANGITVMRTFDPQSTLAFNSTVGYVDDDGDLVDGYIRVGDLECMAISGAAADGALTLKTRGALGSFLQEVYIEAGEDSIEVIQGLAFPGVSWPRMLLYLMLGGSGVAGLNDAEYDKGWTGTGVYVDSDLVDKETFVAAVTRLGDTLRDNWAFFGPSTLARIMESEGLLSNSVVRQKSALLSLAIVTRAMEADGLVDLTSLEQGYQHHDERRRGYSSGENMISNALELKGAWNHATDSPGHTVEAYQGTSVTSRGIRNKQAVAVIGIEGKAALVSRAQDLTAPYFSVRAFQRASMEFPYALDLVWSIAVLDNVLVSDDLFPSLSVNGAAVPNSRGFTDALAQVVSVRTILPALDETDAERGRIGLMTTARDASRYSYWAPSALCQAVLGGTSTELQCDDHGFSGDESTVIKDVQYFDTERAGSSPEVFIYEVGNYASGVYREVVSVTISGVADSSIIEVGSSVALTPPLVIEPTDYDDADINDEQRRYAYQSDGDAKLDKSSGSDLAYKYS